VIRRNNKIVISEPNTTRRNRNQRLSKTNWGPDTLGNLKSSSTNLGWNREQTEEEK
jgi:hypothetical protein